MREISLSPIRLQRLTQARMDFGLPYISNAEPVRGPLPFPEADTFKSCPPLTGGFDSYDSWVVQDKPKLHHTVEIENGYADRRGNVFDSQGRRISLASHKSKLNPSFAGIERNAWKKIRPVGFKDTFRYDGDIFVVTASTSKMYYHGLLEIVPRLHMAQKMRLKPQIPVYVDASQAFMKECLKALKIDNYIDASLYPRISARKMIVPSYEIGSRDSVPEWTIALLNELFPNRSEKILPHKKIYLARRNVWRRQIVNENEIAAALTERGFETLLPESMSIQEQANIFRQAAVVVGPSGGAFTNIAFCQPGAAVVSFFHWQAENSMQKLSAAANLRYAYVASRPSRMDVLLARAVEIKIEGKNIHINLNDLKQTLNMCS